MILQLYKSREERAKALSLETQNGISSHSIAAYWLVFNNTQADYFGFKFVYMPLIHQFWVCQCQIPSAFMRHFTPSSTPQKISKANSGKRRRCDENHTLPQPWKWLNLSNPALGTHREQETSHSQGTRKDAAGSSRTAQLSLFITLHKPFTTE